MHAKNANVDNAAVKAIIKELKKHKQEHNGASTDEFIISVLARGSPAGFTYQPDGDASHIGPCMWWAGASASTYSPYGTCTNESPVLQRH